MPLFRMSGVGRWLQCPDSADLPAEERLSASRDEAADWGKMMHYALETGDVRVPAGRSVRWKNKALGQLKTHERALLGYLGDKDSPVIQKLFKGHYRGRRYAFGYPACPRLEDQVPLLRLLGADRIGVSISDEWQLHPEQSTSAIVLHHPRAKYFSV